MHRRISIAMAVLVRHGRVLLVHRHPAREAYPGRWALPGGHLERGELPHQAASRECHEELGVRIHDPLPVAMTIAARHLHTTTFLVTLWTGEPVNAAPDEHDQLRWFGADELPALELAHPESLPDLRAAIARALDP